MIRRLAYTILLLLDISFGICQTTVISKDFLLGRHNYSKDTSFIKVSNSYTDNQVYLKKEAYNAFLKMQSAALKDGIRLKILSGTRSFYDQKYKWESKWNISEFAGIKDFAQKVRKLLRWWSMPGTSRHHWGTEIDLNNMKLAYYKTGEGMKFYNWLSLNAPKYGFYQPFNANRSSGYQEEKWHWSYVPLSKIYLREYIRRVTYVDISGFAGSHTARELDIIKNWVLAVNPLCR